MNIMKKQKSKPYKVGLAFGGGGARGFAHLGALKAFEEEGIEFDEVAGTSVGSIVASLYAFGLSSDEMLAIAKKLKVSDIKTNKLFFLPSNSSGVENLVRSAIGNAFIEDMKKPLTIVAVDIVSAREIDIKKGDVAKAVAGSCAVPFVFEAVPFGEYNLVDGGIQNTIPADVLRKDGCKYVVSIDVNPTRCYGTTSLKQLDILKATFRILMNTNAIKGKNESDIVIETDTSKYKSTSLEGAEEMYKIGYESAKKAIPDILKLFEQEKKPKRFGFASIFGRKKDKKPKAEKKSKEEKKQKQNNDTLAL